MPVYNEAGTVSAVLDAVREYFAGEVIVVDDGSDDDTPRVLAERSDITVVHLDRNCGYGCALKIGFQIARDLGVDRLITMDCDGQHEPAHIPQFFAALDQGGDIVSGSRYLPGSKRVDAAPPERRAINARVTAVINEKTGWGLTDAFCGFKAYRLDAIGCIELTEHGYAMPLELWAKSWKCGLQIREIPVERIYCDRDRSFGSELDDPDRRFAYYMNVWNQALEVAR